MNGLPTFTTVIGIDPSLTSTGIAVISVQGALTELWTAKSTGKAGATWDQRGDRIIALANKITKTVPRESLVMIEAPAYSRTMANSAAQHDRAGLWWELHRQLRDLDCTVLAVPPTVRAKYATGKGNASKDAVLAAVVKRYSNIDVTGNDTADALILAAIGARLAGWPIDDLPKVNLTAMQTLSLP